jgi:hypothetical protein
MPGRVTQPGPSAHSEDDGPHDGERDGRGRRRTPATDLIVAVVAHKASTLRGLVTGHVDVAEWTASSP